MASKIVDMTAGKKGSPMAAPAPVLEPDFDMFAPAVIRDPQHYDGLVREEGRENLVRFGHAQFNAFGPKNEIYRQSMAAAVEVFGWIAEHCQRDAVRPGGIAMMMYEAADAGDITAEEAELLVRTLYSAGSDTTIFAIGNTLRALAEGVSLLSALARHVRTIERAGEPEVTANMAVHGHEALPLRLVAA